MPQTTDGDEGEGDSLFRPFDPYRRAGSPTLKATIEALTSEFLAAEDALQIRQRKRREKDLAVLHLTLEALLCDLIHLAITAPGQPLLVPRSKATLSRTSRYRPQGVYSEALPQVIDLMANPALAWVREERGGWQGAGTQAKGTLLWPTSGLTSRLDLPADTFRQFTRAPGEEVIILRAPRQGHAGRGELVEYADTPTTERYRAEVHTINKWLAALDLEVTAGGVDLGARTLKRHFNQGDLEFCKGGRLFGGFWERMKKEERARGLCIAGEPTVTLDYGQTFLRLLYAREGLPAPHNMPDLYAVPGFEACREGVKRMLNPLLFRDSPMVKFPRGGVGVLFPPGTRCAHVVQAIREAHWRVERHFETPIGFDLMHTESMILVGVLMRTVEEKVPALPVHDAVIVPVSLAPTAEAIMRDAWRRVTGQEPRVGYQ